MAIFRCLQVAYYEMQDDVDYMDLHSIYIRLDSLKRFFVEYVGADFFQESLVYLGVSLQGAVLDLLQRIFLRKAEIESVGIFCFD